MEPLTPIFYGTSHSRTSSIVDHRHFTMQFGEEPGLNVSTTPGDVMPMPTKRARAQYSNTAPSGTSHLSSKAKGKQRRSLSLLLEMPLDVLFEIFTHLHPRDIVNLTRTTKLFRKTLLSRNAMTIWKAVSSNEGTPECPSWMCEPAWIALLFEPVCQSCGARNIQKIDFLLLKRVCLRCKKSHLLNEVAVYRRYAGKISLDIAKLLPATNISSWSHKYTSRSELFWDIDMDGLVVKLTSFQQDVDQGVPDAQKLLDDFKDEQKQKVRHIKENFQLWNNWYADKQREKRRSRFEIYAKSWPTPMFIPPSFCGSRTYPSFGNDMEPLFDDVINTDFTMTDIDFERDFAQWFSSDLDGDVPNFEPWLIQP